MARVTGDAPSNFQNTVQITVGANRGVKVGMPVLSNAGLVGKITKVYSDTAEVSLITDPSYSVGAEVLVSDRTRRPAPTRRRHRRRPTVAGRPTRTADGDRRRRRPPRPPPARRTGHAPTDADVHHADGRPSDSTTTTAIRRRRPRDRHAAGPGRAPIRCGSSRRRRLSASTIKVGDARADRRRADDLRPEGSADRHDQPRSANRPGSRTPIVEVEPNADLDQLYFVSVVLYIPGDERRRLIGRRSFLLGPLVRLIPVGSGVPRHPADGVPRRTDRSTS